MRVAILFLLRTSKKNQNGNCPIYVRVTHKKRRIELSTGLFVHEDAWSPAIQQVEGKSAEIKSINNRLRKIYSNILDAYYRLEASNEDFEINQLKYELTGISDTHTLFEIFDYYINIISSQIGNGFSPGTLKHYKTSLQKSAENRTSLSWVDFVSNKIGDLPASGPLVPFSE